MTGRSWKFHDPFPKIQTRTVPIKKAVMAPRVLDRLRNQSMALTEVTGKSPGPSFYQGMEVVVRDDIPDDKVYIMETGWMDVPDYVEPEWQAVFVSEPPSGPLAVLDAAVEAVCAGAR